MRVGIITLTASDNCGSLLQAYALQTYLKREYPEQTIELIDFSSKASREMYQIIPIYMFHHPLLLFSFIQKEERLWEKMLQKRDYQKFRRKYLNLSHRKFRNGRELYNIGEVYDIVICGSDQVWNIRMQDFDSAFYLPWVKSGKKIAYAPSLGRYYPSRNDADSLLIQSYLESFDKISVRESFGKKELESIIGQRKVSLLVDPTLLLEEECYNQIIGEPLHNEEYIFYYSWAYKEVKLNYFVQSVAKKYNMKVYVINQFKWKANDPKDFGFYMERTGGPLAFLNLMKYAKLVFVESFHGVIFSSIYKKNFWLLDSESVEDFDPRLKDILFILDLEDRVIREEDYKFVDVTLEPDYCHPRNELKKRIQQSKEFIADFMRE